MASAYRPRSHPGPRTALSIMEVMISLMVFAIVVSAIASNWFTLREVQKLTQAEAKVHELAQSLSERIVGANWEWIGRDRPDELKLHTIIDTSVVPQTDPPTTRDVELTERIWRRYAWSWHRREFPRTTGARIRLPPLTDRDWATADYARFRNDPLAPLSSDDVERYDPLQAVDERINPHNLIDLGVIDRPTGLANLQVYVEYYHGALLDGLFAQDLADETIPFWKDAVRGIGNEALIFGESPFLVEPPEEQMNTSDSAISLQAMVVRIIITWGATPKAHRHEVVLARRK